jgi:hypothetical protein
MLSKKKILSTMAGLAMLALPVSALAGHKHDNPDRFRPYTWHDQGWHRGWDKRQIVPTPYQTAHNDFRNRVNRYTPGPLVWNGGDNADWAHPGYHRAWDRDGDSSRWVPNGGPGYYHPVWGRNVASNYNCDADGDNCPGINNGGTGYWNNNGGYNYGQPYSWYQAEPPAAYGLAQQRDWLIAKRQRAMETLARMRARGDSRAAARMVPIVNALNRRIARLNSQVGGRYGANDHYQFAPASAYVPPINSMVAPGYTANSRNYGGSNYYGTATPYYGNTTLGALSSIAAPLFGVR